jgi:hypothetical protein
MGLVLAMQPVGRVAAQVPNVDVKITADNAYGFGWGTATTLSNYFGGVENFTAAQIFNCPLGNGPEGYVVSGANLNDYLYIVGWSDDSVTQGVIGQFRVGTDPALYTGGGAWEVYATGIDFDIGLGGPPVAAIDTQIVTANAAAGAPGLTSIGWVGTVPVTGREGVLVFGEDNTTPSGGSCANPFPIVCSTEIDAAARWMWYQRPSSACAFLNVFPESGNHREFLIFRISIRAVFGVGRMTGGGKIGSTDVSHGFELHCDRTDVPNNLQINWGKGNHFHLDAISSATCSMDPTFAPAPPAAGFNTYIGSGTGNCNGTTVTANWIFTDAGEPGRNDDAEVHVLAGGTCPGVNASGKLRGGNHQAHAR